MNAEHQVGQPAPVTRTRWWLPGREDIGNPDCLLMHRWTLARAFGCKLLLHHFLPLADDTDPHDHPRGFLTIVLRGGYLDIRPDGYRELLTAPTIRWRPATHAHRTAVTPAGAWTLVIMGRLSRPWGFWRDGRWFEWRDYERRFGMAMRCDGPQ